MKVSSGVSQKLRILYIRDFLMENSNAEHPVSVARIIEHLDSNGINVERKSVYDDIEQLRLYGDDILLVKGKNGGYFYASTDFELPEIKMLVDSVQSSKFITEKQSLDMIKKLEHLTNKYEASQLQRQVVVHNRVKTEQTNIFNNIDHIATAINEDCTVRFKYFNYNIRKAPEFRHGGKVYEISPVCLIWEDENYYMLGFDTESDTVKHYRVDRMKNVLATQNKRTGHEAFDEIDLSSYNKKVFSMFHGEEKNVKIRFSNQLVNVVLDRFGKDVSIFPEADGEHFTVSVDVVVSKQFYSWLFGFPGECEVISPQEVRQELKEIANQTARLYE